METIQTPGVVQGLQNNLFRSLKPDVLRRVKGLKSLQRKHTALQTEYHKEILALEKKYLELYTPLYQRRAEIVNGKSEPTDAEVAEGKSDNEGEEEEEEEKDNDDDDKDAPKVEGVPSFWLFALKTNPMLMEIITENDEEALKHLVDIRLSYFEKPGFRLEFEFSPNEFFTNTILTKTYYYDDEPAYGGDYVFERAEGTKVDWKEGKDLSVTVETKKQRHKGTNKTRVVKKVVPADTFFSFFTPPETPDEDAEDAEDLDEDLDQKLEMDYNLGEEIKDNIIPRAVDWFTGKALQYQGFDDQYDDEFMYEDEDDEEDEDEDEEEDDDDDGPPTKDDKTPECKQQ